MRWLAAAVVLASTPAFAEPLPVKLPDGAAWTMTAERRRELWRDDGAPKVTTVTTTTDLIWKATGPDKGWLTYAVASAQTAGLTSEEVVGAMGLERPIVLEVSDDLTPTKIRNWAEVRERLDISIEKLVPDPKSAAGAKEIFARLSAEQAARFLIRDLSMVAVGQGTTLDLGQPFEHTGSLPSPLGGPPIKSLSRYELTSFTPERAVVTWRQTFDPDSVTSSISQMLLELGAKIAPDQLVKAREVFAGMKIEREDICRHEIDVPTGLAVKVLCTSTATTTAQGQTARNVDRWTITQTLPKASP